jgi:uncharacterized protein with PIN domain
MRGVQCGVCAAVWLSPAATRLVEKEGGCLRCDGPLRQLTEEETAAALKEQAERERPGGSESGA